MAYSTNPHLVKARAAALQLLVRDGLQVGVVARKCGIHRTTLWRWKRKWDELNKHVEFANTNRPGRSLSLSNKLHGCTWQIATMSLLTRIPLGHPPLSSPSGLPVVPVPPAVQFV